MLAPISISIALCTCNGERFLVEQLTSLANQHCLPSELVVCDDASDDGTYKLLERFARSAPFPVRLYRNPKRLGIGQNFEQAIRLCTGSVIALCDQDDVWMPEKLARFTKAFAGDAEWACCDAEVVDATLIPLGYTLWERVNFCQREWALAWQGGFFEVLLKRYVVAGATLAFKAELRDRLLPIPADWHYDAWLAAILAATAKVALVEAAMQCYRQHGSNALGGVRRSLPSEVRAAFSLDRSAHCREEIARWSGLAEHLGVEVSTQVETGLVAKLAHLKRRAGLPANRLARLPAVAVETARGGYARYARNWGSIALDLLLK